MTETQLSKKVLNYLNSLPSCKAIKIHGSAYQEAGTPDILCCHKGHLVFIELKVSNNEPTNIQLTRLCQWELAGATATVCWSLDEVKNLIH